MSCGDEIPLPPVKLSKDQKGLHKRGIHDQGGFLKYLLEAAV